MWRGLYHRDESLTTGKSGSNEFSNSHRVTPLSRNYVNILKEKKRKKKNEYKYETTRGEAKSSGSLIGDIVKYSAAILFENEQFLISFIVVGESQVCGKAARIGSLSKEVHSVFSGTETS